VESILDATERLLVREGARGVTRAQVAAEARLSEATVYRYFPGPAAILAAWEERMLDRTAQDFMARTAGVLAGSDSLHERAYAIAHAAADVVARAAVLYRFDPGDAALMTRTEAKLEQGRVAAQLLGTVLAELHAEILPQDRRLAAMLVVKACVKNAFTWACDFPSRVENGAFQHEMATMIMRYLLRRPDAGGWRPPAPVPDAPSPVHVGAAREQGSSAKEPRKSPLQERSAETIAVLLEATRRSLVRWGIEGVTTTRVAEEAGVSVGTLYQYFPTKEALVAAWEEQMHARVLAGLTETLGAALAREGSRGRVLGAEGAFRIAHATISGITENARLYQFNPGEMRLAARTEKALALASRATELLAAALEHEGPQIFPRNRRDAALLVVTTGVALSFLWPSEHPEDVASGGFQRELATMITRYLAAQPGETPFATG
jgi:AcrR family transcriptional regulator